MKRMVAALLGLMLALPLAHAAEGVWYKDEGVLRLEKSAPLTLRVEADGFEGALDLALPQTEGEADLPLAAVFFTLKEARFAQAADAKAAADALGRLFFLPEGAEAAFEANGQGFALADALPVTVKETALLDGAALLKGADQIRLSSLAAKEGYAPLTPAYRGYATARSSSNVRESASQTARRLAIVEKGTRLPVTGEDKGWHRVLLPDGQEGYMAPRVVVFEPLQTADDVPALLKAGDMEGAQAVLSALGLHAAAATIADYARYLDAVRIRRAGDYPKARAAFEKLGAFGGADKAAQRLEGLESLPAQTLLAGGGMENAVCELQLRAGRAGDPYLVKVYGEDGTEPAAVLFVPSGGAASVALPLGAYRVTYASGSLWYGMDRAFGETGRYEQLTAPVVLDAAGQRCVLTFAPEERPNGAHTSMDFTAF